MADEKDTIDAETGSPIEENETAQSDIVILAATAVFSLLFFWTFVLWFFASTAGKSSVYVDHSILPFAGIAGCGWGVTLLYTAVKNNTGCTSCCVSLCCILLIVSGLLVALLGLFWAMIDSIHWWH